MKHFICAQILSLYLLLEEKLDTNWKLLSYLPLRFLYAW
jgi:hypothetical protein